MSWEFGPNDSSADEIRKAFRVFGFAVIRSVLNRHELTLVRAELDRTFGSDHLRDLAVMCSTELLKYQPIWRCLFKESVVRSLRAALDPSCATKTMRMCSEIHMGRLACSVIEAGIWMPAAKLKMTTSASRSTGSPSAGYFSRISTMAGAGNHG